MALQHGSCCCLGHAALVGRKKIVLQHRLCHVGRHLRLALAALPPPPAPAASLKTRLYQGAEKLETFSRAANRVGQVIDNIGNIDVLTRNVLPKFKREVNGLMSEAQKLFTGTPPGQGDQREILLKNVKNFVLRWGKDIEGRLGQTGLAKRYRNASAFLAKGKGGLKAGGKIGRTSLFC